MSSAADYGLREIENEWIALPDGVRLAARIFMPKKTPPQGLPAILEYLPYRKRDFMRRRDNANHRWFALNGYVAVRVDVRGTGDSEGLIDDEYSPQELEDAVSVIEWIAAQDWCSGAVGMMGISWGGFNALQVAALRPPALKAVISLCSTDDRYADDAHFMGGCLLTENLQWGSILMQNCALPPDPVIHPDNWREAWRARLEHLPPFPAIWMSHPARDAYWKHGSVCENYESIACPVYAVGGWADGYTNAVLRLLRNLSVPRRGLIGPWAHVFPHNGCPGPAIGFLQEAKRWWDRWLKGQDTGIMNEPMLRVWMQEWTAPASQHETWPGRWIAEPEWPSKQIQTRVFSLASGILSSEKHVSPDDLGLSFSSPQTTGVRSGEWCAFGIDGEMPRDQRVDDGNSLFFDSDPLKETFEILGSPLVELEIASDRPVAKLAVRLNDVAPDGSSLRVTYGLLNLTQRERRDVPETLVPGQRTRISIPLNDIAHVFRREHRIRLSFSTAYWPIAWPDPQPVTITIFTGTLSLRLPERPPRSEDEILPEFEQPEEGPVGGLKKIRPLPMRRELQTDLVTDELVYTLRGDGGEFGGASLVRLDEIGLEIGYTMLKRFRIMENDPLSASAEMSQNTILRRDGWSVWVELKTQLKSSEHHFQFTADLKAFENGKPFTNRSWTLSIPRQFL